MSEHVEVTLPAQPEFLYLARLMAGSIAGRLDLSIEEIEDLHLAVDELCLSVLDPHASTPDTIRIDLDWDRDELRISCRARSPRKALSHDANSSGLPASLSLRILDALVDRHGEEMDGGELVAWLAKSRKSSSSES